MRRPGGRPAAVAALLAPLLLVGACSSEEAPSAGGASSSASATASSSTGASASPGATTAPGGSATDGATEGATTGTPEAPAGVPAGEGSVGVTTLAPVAAGEDAGFGDGLVARTTGSTEVEVVGTGPGEVSGPGVAVTVELENGTASDVDLSSLVVNGSVDGAPAPQSSAEPSAPATGVLAPGASAEGTWVFAVPAGSGASLRLEITSTSSTTVVVLDS